MNRKLTVEARGDLEIMIRRSFRASRRLVFDAWTRPELLRRWLGVFGGWSMSECTIDLRVGGEYRYVWSGPDGQTMGMGGSFREIVPEERIVTTERFDEAWYQGDAIGTAVFEERDGETVVTTTIVYDSRETRDGVLRSPMETGLEAGYGTLDGVLESL